MSAVLTNKNERRKTVDFIPYRQVKAKIIPMTTMTRILLCLQRQLLPENPRKSELASRFVILCTFWVIITGKDDNKGY